MGADPTTSVVVIAREAPDQARALVESVLGCTGGSFELVLVDDGSPPDVSSGLEALAEEFGTGFVRVRGGTGLAAASNAGWRAARGSEVCLLDSGAGVTPGWLPALRAALHSAPDVGAVGSRAGDPQRWSEPERLTGSVILTRRAALEQIGGLDDSEALSERLRAAGWRLLSTGEPVREEPLAKSGEHPPAPFILGAPRSGTTLLRMMLDAHPQLAIPPETHFIPELLTVWEGAEDPPEAFAQALARHPRWHSFHLDLKELRRELADSRPRTAGDAIRTFYTLYAERHGKSRWGDKTPPYVRAMPRIAEALPEAHFVHIIRDGRDVVASLRRVWFGPSEIEEAARLWRSRVLTARNFGHQLPGYTEVRYERLVAEPQVILRRLCLKLALDFDPVMLRYHQRAEERLREDDLSDIAAETDLAEGTDPNVIHEQVTRPPDQSRAGMWRQELTPDDQRRFFSVAGNLLQRLGYPLT